MKTINITNHDLPHYWWLNNFTREELRAIARRHGVMRGRSSLDTAYNLMHGKRKDGVVATWVIGMVTY